MTKSIEEQAAEYTKKRKITNTEDGLERTLSERAYIDAAKSRDKQWLAVVNELKDALKHTNEFCLCKRNTYGFDYHEDHPVMGKAKSGSRWLTPRDYIKTSIAKAELMMKDLS